MNQQLNIQSQTKMLAPLIGSYKPEDCLFLIQEITGEFTTIADKERLIQSGKMHYSETISKEKPPTAEYLEIFYKMTDKYKKQLAADCMRLARIIIEVNQSFIDSKSGSIVIASLARAGTPIGVLVKHALKMFNVESVHYSLSIIRDIGVDKNAINYIINKHGDQGICFVDGWTAKGVITRQLHKSITEFNQEFNTKVSKDLYVVSDIGGTADHAATFADYTIPSSLLNAVVSGMVSRTINNEKTKDGFHGCVVDTDLIEHDVSQWFIDQITPFLTLDNVTEEMEIPSSVIRESTTSYLNKVMADYGVTDINRIKPGIAEATRVMLRRVPDVLIVKDINSPDTEHVVRLANEKGISIVVDETMAFGACALIKDVTE